ncbi:MAG: type II toxin-antitoxin system HipA family toxin [Polyangiaceae bacterium]
MARPSHARKLGVWANGLRVGSWTIPSRGPMEFRYDPEWMASPEARPLSLSLPMNLDGAPVRGDVVEFYFDNLLPDSDAIRRRIQQRFHTRSLDTFALLEAIGRDCVGAIQLLPEGLEPQVREIHAKRLSEQDVEHRLIAATASGSLGSETEDDFRISLAGAQEKTALLWHGGSWCQPLGSTPTSHIFKLPLGLVGGRQMDMSDSLENEWLCGRLLGAFGVSAASSELRCFGETRTLVVTRFDRELHSSKKYWLRLPQEDFCQATGTPNTRKYEADGGPGLLEIGRILQGSVVRERDLATLFRSQLLFWMLGAIDGHAKNFSLRLLPAGRYRLTPLYDVLSAWPVAGTKANQIHSKKMKLAMALRGKGKHYRIDAIRRRHFNETAKRCGLVDMDAIIDDVVEKTPAVVDTVARLLPKAFPPALFETVTNGLRRSAEQLART